MRCTVHPFLHFSSNLIIGVLSAHFFGQLSPSPQAGWPLNSIGGRQTDPYDMKTPHECVKNIEYGPLNSDIRTDTLNLHWSFFMVRISIGQMLRKVTAQVRFMCIMLKLEGPGSELLI